MSSVYARSFNFQRCLPVLGAALMLTVGAGIAGAQKKPNDPRSGYDRSARATLLHPANVYIAADSSAQQISLVTPGHEVVIVERSGAWVRVFANTDLGDEENPDEKDDLVSADEGVTPASGWIRDKGIVSPQTAQGDVILFGAAADLEDAAAQPHAPKDAAGEAHLLYRRVAAYFPNSTLAGEAAWRSADVRWQIDKRDAMSLPSAKEQEAYLRPQIFEGEMKNILKTYPGTKYASLAAFDLLDNKLCGDWQGLPKCPEMEAGLYEKYADKNPGGPKTAEALYNAAYREGVLVSMYTVEDNRKRAAAAAQRTQELAEELRSKFAGSDFAARARSIAFRVQQGIPIFGNDRD